MAVPTAAWADGWSPAATLAQSPRPFYVGAGDYGDPDTRLATNARGDAAVAWVRGRTGEGGTCCFDKRIVVSVRRAGAGFGRPQVVSPLGEDASKPAVAIDADGNALVAWQVDELDTVDSSVSAAWTAAGGRFGRPVTLSRLPVGSASGAPTVAATYTTGGEALVAWQSAAVRPASEDDFPPERLVVAVKPPGEAFGAPAVVSAKGLGFASMQQSLVPDAAGGAGLVWVRDDARDAVYVEAAERPAGGRFGAPVALSDVQRGASTPRLARAADGSIGVVWTACCPTAVQARFGPSLHTLGRVEARPFDGSASALLIGDGEQATAIAETEPDGSGASPTAYAIARSPGAGLGEPRRLGDAIGWPSVAFDGHGGGFAAWIAGTRQVCDEHGCNPSAYRLHLGAAGGDGALTELPFTSPSKEDVAMPAVRATGPGAAIAVWQANDDRIRFSGYGAPVPAPGASGRPALPRFSRVRVATRGRRATAQFSLSEKAHVVLEIIRATDVSADLSETVGQIDVRGRAGSNSIPIPSRVGGRKLRRGHYFLGLLAEDRDRDDSPYVPAVRFRLR